MNKNVADYTNFQGKTNKKIVQAPGGSSSFSLAWSNQKTDYGPPRAPKVAKKDMYAEKKNEVQINYQQNEPNYPNYEIPISYNRPQQSYSNNDMNLKKNNNYGQQKETNAYGKNYGNYYQEPEALDRAVYQQIKVKQPQMRRPPSQPKNDGKSCIRINGPPKAQFSIGDANYNYWKDQSHQKKGNSSFSSKKIQSGYQQNQKVQQPIQKPSVRVSNPPGGKGSFAFG